MEHSSVRASRYWQVLFLFTTLVILANVAVVVYNFVGISQSYQAMQRALETMIAVRTTHSAIQDVEISERDHVLWHNEKAVQVYRESVARVINEMRDIYAKEPEILMLPKFAQFESLLLRRLGVNSIAELDFPYAGVPTSAENWNWGENVTLLQDIRGAVQAIETSYDELLASRSTAIESSKRSIAIALGLVTTIGILGMAIMYNLLQRSLAQQKRWEIALLQHNDELEDRVAMRTAALEEKSRDLQRSNRELEEFAFIVSHDLQEPLRKIQAFGDRLKSRCAQELGENVDYLERMQSAATRMARLIQDLLELARVTAAPKKFGSVSLEQVLADVLDDLEESLTSSGATVHADPLPAIEADGTQMRQLFQNLIANAIKFVDQTVAPEIRLTAAVVHSEDSAGGREMLELHLMDNGIGFSQEYADRIFKPFQRLHSRSQYSGTGIGLALCQRIVQRHHGLLRVSSNVERGSDFTVILPLRQLSSADESASNIAESIPPLYEVHPHEPTT